MERNKLPTQSFVTDSVLSKDGTRIGYRQFGDGPGVILVHGGMQSVQSFTKLAEALSNSFTVYVHDRRGRGLSGPYGDNYGINTECEDIDAILRKTGAHNIFGLSSGALISLQSALTLPAIHKLAIYEPPLSINHSTPVDWVTRYDREVAEGNLASAFISAMRGTQTAVPIFSMFPRWMLIPLIRRAMEAEDKDNKDDAVPVRALVPTMHFDVQLVFEMEGAWETFKNMHTPVLLLGGSKSPAYLKVSLDALEKTLPNAKRIEFPGFDHISADNNGKPQAVAKELSAFFA